MTVVTHQPLNEECSLNAVNSVCLSVSFLPKCHVSPLLSFVFLFHFHIDICEDAEIRERIEQLKSEQESKRLAEAQRRRVRRSQSNNTRYVCHCDEQINIFSSNRIMNSIKCVSILIQMAKLN